MLGSWSMAVENVAFNELITEWREKNVSEYEGLTE